MIECCLQHIGRRTIEHVGERIEQGCERSDPARRAATKTGLVGVTHCVDETVASFACPRIEFANAGVADAPLRHVEHTLDADFVCRIDDGAQIRHCVFDLAPIVEARATHHLVGNALTHQRFFDHAALRVGAVKDGDLFPHHGLVVVNIGGSARHPHRLIAFVVGVITGDGLTPAKLAPQGLELARRVVGDDRVRGIENDLCAAIVLVEHDGGHIFEGFFELQDVAQIGATKAVHRLVLIAHNSDVLIGVLILVDEDVQKALLVLIQHFGMLTKEQHHIGEQIVEIHCAGLVQPHLIIAVDLGVLAI